ncbi:hypothetical protein MA20_32755 [Bradyrhizobium japonicum]|uniref:Uncharacterized protein n=1 Tax=Bradyrhizobium japonicum TaxID=375 RepID=A0A0A3XLL1_BRAJP|nr:hypothetical protein MA20_32755 [Bradyrhizobium japonicum]
MCVAGCNSELVVGTAVVESDEFDAGVGVAINKIAVGRRPRDTRKDANATVVAFRHTIELLLEYHPTADITGQEQRFAAANG